MTDKEDVLARVKRATQGLLILNAVSYAVQLAFAERSGAARKDDGSSLKKLPQNKALAIVEAILQYLLNFYAEAKQGEFSLNWNGRISAEKAIQNLRSLIRSEERRVGKECRL